MHFIEPFSDENLKRTHYTLNPGRVLRRGPDGEWDTHFTFHDPGRRVFEIKANEYVVVEARQTVKIQSDGIVGRFVTTSTNIESGFLIVAGQIDSHYGTGGEALRFGVKNLLSEPNELRIDSRLVHLELFDIRGVAPDPVGRTRVEEDTWRARVRGPEWERADSDGVRYE